jgi:hypothetical protein
MVIIFEVNDLSDLERLRKEKRSSFIWGFTSGLGLGVLMVAIIAWAFQNRYIEEMHAIVHSLGGRVEFGMGWVIADIVLVVIGMGLIMIGAVVEAYKRGKMSS